MSGGAPAGSPARMRSVRAASAAAAAVAREWTTARIEADQQLGTKQCAGPICQGLRRPRSCFGPWAPSPDGLKSQCRQCCAFYARQRRRAQAGTSNVQRTCHGCGKTYAGDAIPAMFTGRAGQPVTTCQPCRIRTSRQAGRREERQRAGAPPPPPACDDCDVANCCRDPGASVTGAGAVLVAVRVPSASPAALLIADAVRREVAAQRERERAHLAWCLGRGEHPDPVIRQRLAEVAAARRRRGHQRDATVTGDHAKLPRPVSS